MTTTTTPEAPPLAIRPGNVVWLTDRTGPWRVSAIQGDRLLLVAVDSTLTALVARGDVGRVKGVG